MQIPISISIDEEIVKRIDEEKGLATRSRFIEAKLRQALRKEKGKN